MLWGSENGNVGDGAYTGGSLTETSGSLHRTLSPFPWHLLLCLMITVLCFLFRLLCFFIIHVFPSALPCSLLPFESAGEFATGLVYYVQLGVRPLFLSCAHWFVVWVVYSPCRSMFYALSPHFFSLDVFLSSSSPSFSCRLLRVFLNTVLVLPFHLFLTAVTLFSDLESLCAPFVFLRSPLCSCFLFYFASFRISLAPPMLKVYAFLRYTNSFSNIPMS